VIFSRSGNLSEIDWKLDWFEKNKKLSVDEASPISEELGISPSRPDHSNGMSAADWAISQPTLLLVVMHSSHPVQVVAVVHGHLC
jgi:hypothetical protein